MDSMDLDEAWCTRNLDPASPAWRTILDLAQLKKERLGKHPKYERNITAIIQNKLQLEATLCIPGRDYPRGEFEFCRSLVFQTIRDSARIINSEDVVKGS